MPVPRPSVEASKPAPEAGSGEPAPEKPVQGPPAPATQTEKPEPPPPPPPIPEEDAAAVAACLTELRSAGAVVKEAPRIDPENGCGIARPVVVGQLASDIEIKPEATLRCETALQLQRWTRDAVIPAIKAATPQKRLVALNQASAYVCRNRNNEPNGKLSEHALGNAVDIAGFTYSDGSRLAIAPREKDATIEGALQRAVVASACLYFTTVLDPGSDAAHETHLHLDVKKRTNGYRYCW